MVRIPDTASSPALIPTAKMLLQGTEGVMTQELIRAAYARNFRTAHTRIAQSSRSSSSSVLLAPPAPLLPLDASCLIAMPLLIRVLPSTIDLWDSRRHNKEHPRSAEACRPTSTHSLQTHSINASRRQPLPL